MDRFLEYDVHLITVLVGENVADKGKVMENVGGFHASVSNLMDVFNLK